MVKLASIQFTVANPHNWRHHIISFFFMSSQLPRRRSNSFERLSLPGTRRQSQPVSRRQINGYDVTNELGRGGYSIVYKCSKFGKVMAMKIVSKDKIGDSRSQDCFQREIDTMAYMEHPNIVKLHDFFSDEKNYYLILDCCAGGELKNFIIKNDKLNEPTAALIFQQVCQAIAYCHQSGVAHRDLKPENILIDKFPCVKISDFGLCGYIKDDKLMDTFCGSPSYVAPECLFLKEYDGKKSDIWSLGVILYTMVTGNHPWNCTNQRVMFDQIKNANYPMPDFLSPECKDMISSMIRVNPDERATIEQILQKPWFKYAQKAQVLQRDGLKLRPPQMPGAQEKISEVTTRARRSSMKSDLNKTGLFSPLFNNGKGISLNSTCPRSMSFECFTKEETRSRPPSRKP